MKYSMENGRTSYTDDKLNDIEIANFEARIITELRYIDGKKTTRFYELEGGNDNESFEPVIISGTDFASMNWVANAWGSQAIIYPKNSAKEILRTTIQMESKPKVKRIFTSTGWYKINGENIFLSNNCAISGEERSEKFNVELPPDMKVYELPADTSVSIPEAIVASLRTIDVATREIGWLVLAAVYRASIGNSDFAVHITGRTGTFKSELSALAQSHFGEATARELPGSWSSTANALEALAYRAKDVIFVVDDFIPMGTSYQQKAYQKTADQLVRGQGNQAGRARLTDTSNLQETMYPRGLILSTGEDTPEGHSVRARMMIAELTPGDIDIEKLTKSQNEKSKLQYAMAGFIQWLSEDLQEKRKQAKAIAVRYRDENIKVGHSRTPPMLGELISGVAMFLQFAGEHGMKPGEQNKLYEQAVDSLKVLANRQIEYLTAADPADQFIGVLRSIFAACAGHAKGMHGGIPQKAQLLGWTHIGDPDEMEFKPHGPRMGWVDQSTKTLYLDAAVAYDAIRRHSRGSITITRQTLYKRLREAGHLTRVDDSRQRNTVRVQCEDAGRTCIALSLTTVTEGE